jgi:hypothetical protein
VGQSLQNGHAVGGQEVQGDQRSVILRQKATQLRRKVECDAAFVDAARIGGDVKDLTRGGGACRNAASDVRSFALRP